MQEYNLVRPWVLKVRSDGSLAADIIGISTMVGQQQLVLGNPGKLLGKRVVLSLSWITGR